MLLQPPPTKATESSIVQSFIGNSVIAYFYDNVKDSNILYTACNFYVFSPSRSVQGHPAFLHHHLVLHYKHIWQYDFSKERTIVCIPITLNWIFGIYGAYFGLVFSNSYLIYAHSFSLSSWYKPILILNRVSWVDSYCTY